MNALFANRSQIDSFHDSFCGGLVDSAAKQGVSLFDVVSHCYAVCHVPVVCGGRPSPPWPMSLEYINRFPAKLAIVFKNRPLSSSLRSLNRNACSSRYLKR